MATEIVFRKIGGMAVPATEYDQQLFRETVKHGANFKAQVTQGRNLEYHKRYMAMINFVWTHTDASNDFVSVRHFRKMAEMHAGHFEAVVSMNGKTVYWPKSISFARCDETEFRDIAKGVYRLLWEKYFQSDESMNYDRIMEMIHLEQ